MREEAIALLQHYFALAMGERSAAELNGYSSVEIASIVDLIIKAAVAEARKPVPGTRSPYDLQSVRMHMGRAK